MREFWLSAAIMPSGIATTAVRMMEQSASWKETGAAAETIAQTERPEVSELPNWPCSRFQM